MMAIANRLLGSYSQPVNIRYIARVVLATVAVINILIVAGLWINHINFPLNLELMEGDVLQHVHRIVAQKPIYPQPAPDYVALAYNPLYYFLSVPFASIFGFNLASLRVVAMVAAAGIGVVLFFIVQQRTQSSWWGIIAAGLYAAGYSAMDAYIDSAHSDSWFIFSALLGSYLIDRNRSRNWNVAGVLFLVTAFWFKQHGALFAIGGILFLTWREGIKGSILYWLIALVFGPVLYLFAGPPLFGDYFHYFTWQVPRQWSEITTATFSRYFHYLLRFFPLLLLAGLGETIHKALKHRTDLNIWHVQFCFALLSGLMGALDPGSSDNVFSPAAIWIILAGTLAIYTLSASLRSNQSKNLYFLGFIASFALLVFNPIPLMTSPNAHETYADFIDFLHELDAQVYAPDIGQLAGDYQFYPGITWVPVIDIIRSPGNPGSDDPRLKELLLPVIEPEGKAYVLRNVTLGDDQLSFLQDYYVLEEDLGFRFEALRAIPHRWDLYWPRFLYRYDPEAALANKPKTE